MSTRNFSASLDAAWGRPMANTITGETIAYSDFCQQVPRLRRIGFQLLPQVTHVDAQVDENLIVVGTHRLYVCDMSVLPPSTAANSVRTLTALALRLSEHLG
jgi:hypothetical protein